MEELAMAEEWAEEEKKEKKRRRKREREIRRGEAGGEVFVPGGNAIRWQVRKGKQDEGRTMEEHARIGGRSTGGRVWLVSLE